MNNEHQELHSRHVGNHPEFHLKELNKFLTMIQNGETPSKSAQQLASINYRSDIGYTVGVSNNQAVRELIFHFIRRCLEYINSSLQCETYFLNKHSLSTHNISSA